MLRENFLEVPAGKRQGNETYEEGLIREVKEEAGYTSEKQPVFLGEFMVNPAMQNNKVKTFLILEAYKAYEQYLDDTEDVKVRLFDFEQFGKLLLENEYSVVHRECLFTGKKLYK